MAQGGADCAASALLARQLAMRTAGTGITAPPQCVDSTAMWPQARTAVQRFVANVPHVHPEITVLSRKWPQGRAP